jgi:hypothetical protein
MSPSDLSQVRQAVAGMILVSQSRVSSVSTDCKRVIVLGKSLHEGRDLRAEDRQEQQRRARTKAQEHDRHHR